MSSLRGNDVNRLLKGNVADRHSQRGIQACNKFQKSTINLMPGCVLDLCLICRKCVFFHVIQDKISPILPRSPIIPVGQQVGLWQRHGKTDRNPKVAFSLKPWLARTLKIQHVAKVADLLHLHVSPLPPVYMRPSRQQIGNVQ